MSNTLENEKLRICVNNYAAELSSIYDKENNREILWSGDSKYWNRQAPILFPFVGKVKNGSYVHNGIRYVMEKQHGFARDMDFEVLSHTRDSITHRLVSNEDTQINYPFSFELLITHKIKGKEIEIAWEVINRGNDTMYFSIGAHPGFVVPILENTVRRDYTLAFSGQEQLSYIQIDSTEGLAVPETGYSLEIPEGGLAIEDHMFDNDAFIFDNNQVKKVSILMPDGKPYVTLHCEDFPSLGIWSKNDAPFVCLEPWVGRTDNLCFSGELKDKFGVEKLEAGEQFFIKHTIEVGI
ncbi:aldose 1-epimerase family protein [Lachnospiraceae bacterium OttesenSCG-928-D06]|nr:aldose 1-epimerase family protein [Lachnospiraceae bacterium OttesenSCG-928-D06]